MADKAVPVDIEINGIRIKTLLGVYVKFKDERGNVLIKESTPEELRLYCNVILAQMAAPPLSGKGH